MNYFFERKIALPLIPAVLIVCAAIGLIAYGAYLNYSLNRDLSASRIEYAEAEEQFENAKKDLSERLAAKNSDNEDLLTLLKTRNADFQSEMVEAKAKLSTLEKVQNTDPELLQKYSKVYFLNENFIPRELSLIHEDFLYLPAKPIQIMAQVKPQLENMLLKARAEGVDIGVLSGYRSFGTQAALKSQYTVVYGSGSNRFSADQGYSEHQLGTAVDFTTKAGGEILAGFDKSPAYNWLLQNADLFGFVLSYPKNNFYYIFEPWHWRFVGVTLAKDMKLSGKHFYDMQQRELDSYLLKIFD